LLLWSLRQTAGLYALPAGELPESVRRAWYAAGDQDVADPEEWCHLLREGRDPQNRHLQGWMRVLSAPSVFPCRLRLDAGVCDLFLTILNDRRMALSGEWEVGEGDMERPLEEVEDPGKRRALLEIHFLALIMELVLQRWEA
jgi:hypothetical protein